MIHDHELANLPQDKNEWWKLVYRLSMEDEHEEEALQQLFKCDWPSYEGKTYGRNMVEVWSLGKSLSAKKPTKVRPATGQNLVPNPQRVNV